MTCFSALIALHFKKLFESLKFVNYFDYSEIYGVSWCRQCNAHSLKLNNTFDKLWNDQLKSIADKKLFGNKIFILIVRFHLKGSICKGFFSLELRLDGYGI